MPITTESIAREHGSVEGPNLDRALTERNTRTGNAAHKADEERKQIP
jgi:hypothetical protein